jgi:acetyl-CoA carboxylase carboxyltransferase component
MSSDKEEKQKQLDELKELKAKVLAMGGDRGIERQRKLGKLTARERVDLLLDKGSFVEIGALVHHRGTELGMDKREVPADGVVTGYGKINGRRVYVYSQDFTSLGGTLGEMHGDKIRDVLDRARRDRCPVVGINDSGGARIHEGVDALAGYGKIFFANTISSGVIPQICAILGPTAGGAVYSPALMDFVFMVKKISYAFITGPKVIKAVIGEEIGELELGGAIPQQQKSGVVHRSEDSEEGCLANIRKLLSYLPQSKYEKPPKVETDDSPDRADDTLFDIVPAHPNKPYNMYDLIGRIFDKPAKGEDKNYFDIFPLFATNIITCFTHLNGYSVGIIANQPRVKAGCLDIDACDKAARFIRFCDSFNIPVVNLVDVPGYLPGKDQEWGGIIRHGAKMLYAYSEATVPKITLLIRKAYGGAYIGMCCKQLGADSVLAWPSAELAVMGPEGAAPIIYGKEIAQSEDPKKTLQEKISMYRKTFANPYKGAIHAHVDDVIDPAETRPRLIKALEVSLDKDQKIPEKKHAIPPF